MEYNLKIKFKESVDVEEYGFDDSFDVTEKDDIILIEYDDCSIAFRKEDISYFMIYETDLPNKRYLLKSSDKTIIFNAPSLDFFFNISDVINDDAVNFIYINRDEFGLITEKPMNI